MKVSSDHNPGAIKLSNLKTQQILVIVAAVILLIVITIITTLMFAPKPSPQQQNQTNVATSNNNSDPIAVYPNMRDYRAESIERWGVPKENVENYDKLEVFNDADKENILVGLGYILTTWANRQGDGHVDVSRTDTQVVIKSAAASSAQGSSRKTVVIEIPSIKKRITMYPPAQDHDLMGGAWVYSGSWEDAKTDEEKKQDQYANADLHYISIDDISKLESIFSADFADNLASQFTQKTGEKAGYIETTQAVYGEWKVKAQVVTYKEDGTTVDHVYEVTYYKDITGGHTNQPTWWFKQIN